MRNFVIAVAAVILVFAFAVVNSFIVTAKCDELISLVESGESEKALEVWQDCKNYLAFFVRDGEIDQADLALRELAEAYPETGGEKSVAAVDAIIEIRNAESISAAGVFQRIG